MMNKGHLFQLMVVKISQTICLWKLLVFNCKRNKWCQGQIKGQGQKMLIQFNHHQQNASMYEVRWKYIEEFW